MVTAESGKNSAGGASTKANKGMCITELGSITDTLVEKEHKFFQLQFAQLHEIGKCTDDKLKTTQTELASLSGSINLISAKFLTSGVTVEDNLMKPDVPDGGPGGQKQAQQQPGLPKRGLKECCIASHTVPTEVAPVPPCWAAGDHTGSPNLQWSHYWGYDSQSRFQHP